ncbi:MAG: hypothetical protein GOV00_03040 [Candidatus Altiarchaeota archaeon]|nr:hypothetical protein [Candidatus Altiarchaeota archaeon]
MVERLFSQKCVKYRDDFNTRLKTYLSELVEAQPALEKNLHILLNELNLALPYQSVLESFQHPINIIAVSIARKDSVFMLVQDPSIDPSKGEGAGKTAIASKLLGMEIPYDVFKPVPTNEVELKLALKKLEKLDTIQIQHSNKSRKLVSSDMPFIGIDKNGLSVVGPPKGEYVIAMWDMGRHIMRVIDPNYFPGKRRKDEFFRTYQKTLSKKFYFDFDLFGDPSRTYKISSVFVINRVNKGHLEVEKVSTDETLSELRRLLESNPLYHESVFWDLNKDVHLERVSHILNFLEDLDSTHWPTIYRVSIPSGGKDVIEAAAKTISELVK